MPVVAPGVVSHVILRFSVDMPNLTAVAVFQRLLDGHAIGTVELRVDGDALLGLLGAAPAPGKSRGDDMTDCIYAHALAVGAISGSIA